MTTNKAPFPYIPREGFKSQIQDAIFVARRQRENQVVLLYGKGGDGKTYFVRELPNEVSDPDLAWVGPYDIDDAEYWLLPNLESEIAEKLDPERRFFAPYFDYQSKLPAVETTKIEFETLVGYSRQGERIFFDCYHRFVDESRQIPVLILDTLEAIRGLDFLPRLVRWMKGMKGTVFILASRPMFIQGAEDPLLIELKAAPTALPCHIVKLEHFTEQESNEYLTQSAVGAALSEDHRRAIIDLCDGSPLWLAMTVNYLSQNEVPQEVSTWPDKDAITAEYLRDDFLRRLTVPYRGSDFWAAAVKYLGVVRRRVSLQVWRRLMTNRTFPDGITTWEEAWGRLKALPWIRTRANENYVTLHDAVAEALAQRVIPLDDKDHSWRKALWDAAARTYWELVEQEMRALEDARRQLNAVMETRRDAPPDLIREFIKLSVKTTDYYLLVSTAFYYLMLSDREAGIKKFVELFEDSYSSHAYRLIELLWLELQRFLPGEQTFDPLDDIIKPELTRFQAWYKAHPDNQYEVESRMARYLTPKGVASATEAVKRLTNLLEVNYHNESRVYPLLILRANARLRVPPGAVLARQDFITACDLAKKETAPDKVKKNLGDSLKELGYFHRCTGDWGAARLAYREALEATPVSNLENRAAIQSQFAYVQALRGRHQEAQEMVESALKVRRKFGDKLYIGLALSVRGEVSRYQCRFNEAMDSYDEAESIFIDLARNPWLGVIRQEMAICLFQAARAKEVVRRFSHYNEMFVKAQDLILESIAICRDSNIRNLPLALNRGGRIFGGHDLERGLEYLKEGIDVAGEVADDMFHLANLIELATLSFSAWERTRDPQYLQVIESRTDEINQACDDTDFFGLEGRWEVLRGHIKFSKALATNGLRDQHGLFGEALSLYESGYPKIAKGYQGAYGIIVLHEQMEKLDELMRKLPETERERWLTEIDNAWRNLPPEEKDMVATLNSMLTDLYIEQKI